MDAAEKLVRPTKERLRKAGDNFERIVVDIDAYGRKIPVEIFRMLDGSILDRLIRRNPPAISGAQYHAGGRLYADWYHARLVRSGTTDPTRTIVDGGGCEPESERVVAAKMRYHRAIQALCTRHGMILQCCVLEEEPLTSFGCRVYGANSARLERHAALIALSDALSALDEHYNGKRTYGIRSAHGPGYRPQSLVAD